MGLSEKDNLLESNAVVTEPDREQPVLVKDSPRSTEDAARVLAEKHGVEFIALSETKLSPQVVQIIPQWLATKHNGEMLTSTCYADDEGQVRSGLKRMGYTVDSLEPQIKSDIFGQRKRVKHITYYRLIRREKSSNLYISRIGRLNKNIFKSDDFL